MYKEFIRPILFKMDAEKAHNFSELAIKYLPIKLKVNSIPTNILGLDFKNPVGLAAGFDKNAKLINHIDKLGFGFIEVGTITPLPQEGNPKPRLFRNIKEQSIINRMGFNNDGLKVIKKRLENRKTDIIIGANIGKNKNTSLDYAHLDYQVCFDYLQDIVDYFTLNVSSPNTPGLRKLLEKDRLSIILESVMRKNRMRKKEKPILLKISPDINDDQLKDILDTCKEFNVSGIVATNTTINTNGGLSGMLLENISGDIIRKIKNYSNLTIIGSGGIMNEEIAKSRLNDGCDLIQVYTGLIYEGPSFCKNILSKI